MAQWGIVVGKPTNKNWGTSIPDMRNIGRWVGSHLGLKLYRIREGARQEAKALMKLNPSWNYHAKKYSQ